MPKIIKLSLEPEIRFYDTIDFVFQSYDRGIYSYVVMDYESNTDLGYMEVESDHRVSDDWLLEQVNNALKKAG